MKFFLVLISCVFLTSCVSTNYVLENKTQQTGVDFTEGKWLLNEVEAPYSLEEKLNKVALTDFVFILGDRLTPIAEEKNLLIGRKIALNPSKSDLKNLKTGTNFDYFINIKAKNLKDDLSSFSLSDYKFRTNETNSNEVVLEIYDLNRLEIIFSQKVIATTRIPENSTNDVHFSKSSEGMILKAYKKVFKNLSKKSIK